MIINSDNAMENKRINKGAPVMPGILPETEAVISIDRYKSDNGKSSIKDSDIKSKKSQIIEPIIKIVVSGTITRLAIIPTGAIIPKA
jgi:hypothetical protein